MDISFEWYKIFYHAAANLSFSIAAERLFITQSAVSQTIKHLEEELATPLFLRKARQLQLTVEGEILFHHIEQAYQAIKIGESKLHAIQNLEAGEIRLGASDTVCKYYLLPYLEQFNQRYPQITLRVINRTSIQILQLLKKGSLDFGITTLPVTAEFNVTELLQAEDIFVASSKFSTLQAHSISLAELANYPLLMLEKDSATRVHLEKYLDSKAEILIPEIELESVDLIVEFAKIGLGVGHVWRKTALAAIKSGELFEVLLKESLPLRGIGLVQYPSTPLSKAAQSFVKLLANDTSG